MSDHRRVIERAVREIGRLGAVAITTLLAAACATRQAPPPEPGAEPIANSDTATDTRQPTSAPIVWLEVDDGIPSAPQLCNHIIEMLMKEFAATGQSLPQTELAEVHANCMNGIAEERSRLGEAAYAEQAECIMRGQSIAELERCEQLDATRDGGGQPSPNRDVCQHVMDIMVREFGESAMSLSEADLAAFLDQCGKDLETEQAKIGPAKFQAQVQCVMAAQTVEQLTACDQSP